MKKCLDSIMKYCYGCPYGIIIYPSWVETWEDTQGCCFETKCLYKLELQEPSEEDLKEFEDWCKKIYKET